MNKIIVPFVMLLILTGCQSGNKSDKVTTASEQEAAETAGAEYSIDTTATKVSWRATHKGGLAPRYGNIEVSSGVLSAEDGALSGGNLQLSLNGLKVDPSSVTEPGKKHTDLEQHLKTADFFDVQKYPEALFVITKVAPFDSLKHTSAIQGANSLISGNLTLKDSTLNIEFPAKLTISENQINAQARFTIDRAAWGLSYKTEGSPEDWAISRDVDIEFDIKADKQ